MRRLHALFYHFRDIVEIFILCVQTSLVAVAVLHRYSCTSMVSELNDAEGGNNVTSTQGDMTDMVEETGKKRR